MTPAAAFTSRCRACGGEVAAFASSCPHCNAPNLEERCPHCDSVTTSTPDKELRYHCDLCGGPRVPRLGTELKGGGREAPYLRRANQARKARAKYRAIGAVFGVMGFASVVLAALWLLIFPVYLPLAIAWAFFAGSALFMVLWAMARASSQTKELEPAIDQAWQTAATDIATRIKGPFTAARLAQAMGIEVTQAEDLLAMLDVNDVVRSEVTEAGEVAYETKLRVGANDFPEGGSTPETEALAEAEAMAAEERRVKALH